MVAVGPLGSYQSSRSRPWHSRRSELLLFVIRRHDGVLSTPDTPSVNPTCGNPLEDSIGWLPYSSSSGAVVAIKPSNPSSLVGEDFTAGGDGKCSQISSDLARELDLSAKCVLSAERWPNLLPKDCWDHK